jgi:hypothetical protein
MAVRIRVNLARRKNMAQHLPWHERPFKHGSENSGVALLVQPRSPRSGAPQARALRAATALGPSLSVGYAVARPPSLRRLHADSCSR